MHVYLKKLHFISEENIYNGLFKIFNCSSSVEYFTYHVYILKSKIYNKNFYAKILGLFNIYVFCSFITDM